MAESPESPSKKSYNPFSVINDSGIILMVTAVIFVGYFHHLVPPDYHVLHIAHYYAFYLVVIYAAYRWGLWGGIFLAFVLSMIYDPALYLLFLYGIHVPHYKLRGLVEVSMLYAVGGVAGYFSTKLKGEKMKVEQVSREMLELERRIARDDRLRVLGQLSAGIAHEIRNPLAAIKTGVSLIRDGKATPQVTSIIESEIERLDSFITRFLQYAKMGKNEDSEINTHILTDEAAELARLMCRSRTHIRLECVNDLPENHHIRGDKNALKQALLNILINSIEAMNDTGGEILFRAIPLKNGVHWSITDTGAGVPETLKEQIFEPFFTTKADGTGLGLPLAAKIIREHGGEIAVENTPGACFTIVIGSDE